MIRINLANASLAGAISGTNEAAMSSDEKDIQRQGFTKMVMLLIVPGLFYFYESFILIPDLNSRQASKQSLLASLQEQNAISRGALEEKKKFEEDQERLRKQIGAIDGLSKDRLKEVKILDTIQKDIPEKVWLSELTLQDGKINISGNATSDADLTSFMEALSRSIYIKEVNLVRSAEIQSQVNSGISKRFDITCVINREITTGPNQGGVQ